MRTCSTAIIAAAWLAATAGAAQAQHGGHGGGPATESAPYGSPVDDQHVWAHLILDKLEGRFGDDEANFHWDAEAWTGTDEWRLWLKTEGELTDNGEVEDGQVEAFLSKPLVTFWDAQAGVRYDADSGPGRTWAALGVEGLAPGFFHITATGYAGSKGRTAAKLKAGYEQLVAQKLFLEPEVELNFYGKDDPARGIGSGLSDIDASLRLRYEITRKFSPYVGLAYERKVGDTADLARADGEDTDDLRLTVGVRVWN